MVNNKENTNNKLVKWLIGIILILLIILGIVIIPDLVATEEPELTMGSGVEIGVIDTGETKEEIKARLDEEVKKSMFQVFINTRIKINEYNVADVKIQNTEKNHHPCYVTITLDGTEVYRSDVIEPGYKIESDEIKLDKEPGEYDAIAVFNVMKDGDPNNINSVGVKIQLVKE